MRIRANNYAKWMIVLVCFLSLIVTACDSGGSATQTSSPIATGSIPTIANSAPTATSSIPTNTPTPAPLAVLDPSLSSSLPGAPTIGKISQINLGNFYARDPIKVTPDGIILFGSWNGVTPTNQSAYKSVYFYNFTDQKIHTIATATPAPDGEDRGFGWAEGNNDWIIYIDYTSNSLYWELWATNVATNQKILIDSAAKEQFNAPMGGLTTNGKIVVYAISTPNGPQLRKYDLTSEITTVMDSSGSYLFQAMQLSGNMLFFWKVSGPQTMTAWLWNLDQPAPVQLPVTPSLNVALNGNYLVWDTAIDLGQYFKLSLYNIVTGKVIDPWGPQCYRPGIALDRPYVACEGVNSVTAPLYLVRIPSGTSAPFGLANGGEWGQIVNGHSYWPISNDKFPGTSTFIDYIDVPAQ